MSEGNKLMLLIGESFIETDEDFANECIDHYFIILNM